MSNVISEEQELHLVQQVDKKLKRMRYSAAHFDNAISGYREMHKSRWDDLSLLTLRGLRRFHPIIRNLFDSYDASFHILDLSEEGAGPVIAGLSLLSDSIMTFTAEEDSKEVIEGFLPRRSLYIMSIQHTAFTWNGQNYQRKRRISVLLRNVD
eukprot:gene3689-8346_t